MGGGEGLVVGDRGKSGVVGNPRVSQWRLAGQLGLAFFLDCGLVWLAFELHARARGVQKRIQTVVSPYALGLVVLVFVMALSGALVAGTRAGFAYSTWPLMGNSFIPEGLYSMTPWWRSIFEDITTVQFNHRIFAYVLIALLGAFAVRLWRQGMVFPAVFVVVALTAQVLLGISALLMHVPVAIGAAHQVGAVILLTALIFAERSLVWSNAKV